MAPNVVKSNIFDKRCVEISFSVSSKVRKLRFKDDSFLIELGECQVPSRGPPVRHCLKMLTKPVNMKATTATRTGCVRHGVGHKTPFSGRGSRNAAEDPRPNILQLNTEGLTADKISVIEQLAYKNKAFIIVL